MSQFESIVFTHALEIRNDFLALIRMSGENQLTTKGSSDDPVAKPIRAPGPKFNSDGGLKPL